MRGCIDVETLSRRLAREVFGRVKAVDDILVCRLDMVVALWIWILKERRARAFVEEEEASHVNYYDW